jgi:mRNA interferase RelE/StbE
VRYNVVLETRARREFQELAGDIQERIREAVDDLAEDPRPPGVKKLTGVEGYRLRKGSHRVLFTIDDKAKEVRIYRIGHRREIYR